MSLHPGDVPCTLVNQTAQLAELAQALATAQRVAIDTEVPIDGPRAHQMRVMSLAVRHHDGSERAFVVDGRDLDPTLLGPLLDGVTADAWNANFDARIVDAAVWDSTDTTTGLVWWDAQLADALLHQGRSGFTWYHGLAWATEHYLGVTAEGKGDVQLSYTAHDDLTSQQVAYAAADAVETLWVADRIRAGIAEAGLERICAIEMGARPFLDQMERTGLPYDREGWKQELVRIEQQHRGVVGELAELTGGGQGTLFDDVVEPNWNPASDRQVRDALNRWSEREVRAWTAARHGEARLLTDLDSVTAAALREIGGELSDALLRFRNQSKILTTYGESIFDHLHDDGRLRPQYLQVVGTNTGRLASRNPNAQNFTPLMKPYVRPPEPERVFVHADLSQAELRFLAQVADDTPLRAAFAAGADVHATTAATMFGFDPDLLRAEDPDRFKHLRQIAKALNFGIAYGSGAAALARSVSAEGSPTTVDEAAGLLAQYRRTYPGTAAWASARIAEIEAIRDETSAIDWTLTMRLARGFGDMSAVRRSFRKHGNRWPSAAEIAALHPRRHETDEHTLTEEIGWLLGYSAPVALEADGRPFTFASRTVAGRRQQFNLHLDRLFLVAVAEIIADPASELVAVRRRFEFDNDVVLHGPGGPLSTGELARPLEDRALRRRFIEATAAAVGEPATHRYLGRAAKDRVSAMVNAWRNAPIQGGVADIMLVAYADLDRRLRRFPDARPVQTVHDSVVIECSVSDAEEVAVEVGAALEAASAVFCPDVVPKADIDIRRSLSDDDVVVGSLVPPTGSQP
ncbi:MAG: DNA polymerase [Actinomycetota bacterium]